MFKKTLSGLALATAFLSPVALASDDHDHGAAPAAPAAVALPRFATSSDLFELVGVVKDKQLTVYLDHFADNAPVKGARIDLEIGGAKVALKELATGEFEGTLTKALQPGINPVTATVLAGQESDILAADMDFHEEQHADAATSRGFLHYALWAAAAAALLAAAAWLGRSSRFMRRVGGAA